LASKAIYRLFRSESAKNTIMSRRLFALVAVLLIASVLCAAVAHACSDLGSMPAILQMPCDHRPSQDEPASKKEKDNCDFVRYGMLSTQVSPSQTEILKLHAVIVHEALSVTVSPPDVLPLFSRSQAPPFRGFGVSPNFSHIVLRI
jgi:hypothetical protein